MGIIFGALGIGVVVCVIGVVIYFVKVKKAEHLEQQISDSKDEQEKAKLNEQLQKTNQAINDMTSDDVLHPTPEKEKSDEFNTKGAIIGGALGGITGAYIGSHIKKNDDK